jgi:hypothetical protein
MVCKIGLMYDKHAMISFKNQEYLYDSEAIIYVYEC